jgi:transposase
VEDIGIILGHPAWGKESEVKDTELYAALLKLGAPWVVREVRLDVAAERVDVWIEEATGARWSCPECGQASPVYDHAEERVWRHLDSCDCRTFLHARLPRVKCGEHGIRQVPASWASPGSQFSLQMESRLIDTLRECDVTGVTRLTGTSWDEAWGIVEKAVARGLARKRRRIPTYLCIDEKSFAKRHRYETVICDAERGTVEYVVEDRRQESLEQYYRQFTPEELAPVRAVAMDMWDPYIAATQAYIPEAEEKIVFDKFHVLRTVNEAVDKVRRQEHKVLMTQGDLRLKGTKHLWLANEENVPEWRRAEFQAVKGTNLKTGRAWAIKESLRKFWTYRYAQRAADYFRRWYFWATHSRLTPVVSAAKTLHRYFRNVLTYFRHRLTNATAEGLNSKIQMVKEMACGFRNRDHYKTAIYFHCGGLDLYPRLEEAS